MLKLRSPAHFLAQILTFALSAYLGAVGSSGGIAFYLNRFAKTYQAKPNITPAMRGLVRGFVPFVAVAMAGCVNVTMIRQNELRRGVAVFDEFVLTWSLLGS